MKKLVLKLKKFKQTLIIGTPINKKVKLIVHKLKNTLTHYPIQEDIIGIDSYNMV